LDELLEELRREMERLRLDILRGVGPSEWVASMRAELDELGERIDRLRATR